MTPWTYEDYRKSVQQDVAQAVTKLGFNIDQAIGFAHSELTQRLEEFPNENALALTALAICAKENDSLSTYAPGDELFDEIGRYCSGDSIMEVMSNMADDQRVHFLRDVEIVKKVMGV
jgi:hypothetical protein